MTKKKSPPEIAPHDPHDPFKMRTIEQILTLFDGGDFLTEIMTGHQKLMQDLLDHNAEHGSKGCNGSMTIQLSYAVGNAGDVGMGATVSFKPPKKPASSASAYINDAGELTLYSPMMARMHSGVRDVTPYDPETGEVRDV
ncbi:hypothetical protein [Thalassovita aquimarina]|uniref:Uncharacterized protein n=1 Tax=Thalassovita aquimarina TaxID=2785917 RepID=A0ABS5HSF1_9RHOB|nr:hypothetical protein [Thalassovita aquimarina]MBR9651885.1 hypothetical protein [Thalassovita aquimarina]